VATHDKRYGVPESAAFLRGLELFAAVVSIVVCAGLRLIIAVEHDRASIISGTVRGRGRIQPRHAPSIRDVQVWAG